MKRFISLFVFVLLLITSTVMATVPTQINFQGRMNDGGTPLSGSHPAQLTLFNAETGGSAIWSESDTLQFRTGLFSTMLGQNTPLPASVFTGSSYWLEVVVDGTTLAPRQKLGSNVYAFHAQNADTALVALNSVSGGNGQWEGNGTDVWRGTGRVGIGVTSPASVLDISSTTGDHAVNSIHYSATNPKIKMDALAVGNSQSELQFQRSGATKWGLLNDISGNGGQTIGFKDWVSGTIPFMIDGTGNVGVGTSAPINPLHVKGPGTTAVFEETAANALIRFQDQGTSSSPHVGSAGDDFVVLTGPQTSEKLRVTAGGNVGIGNPNPQVKFEVDAPNTVGGIRLNAPNGDNNTDTPFLTLTGGYQPNNGVALRGVHDQPYGQKAMVFYAGWDVGAYNDNPAATDLIERMRISSSGQVTIPGSLTVVGTKCRMVKDTKYGDLYLNATESAHALFTTEGESQLHNGRAEILLDPKWLASVTVDDQHPLSVWVTFYGPHGDYYVERKTDSFFVIDPRSSDSRFSWKVEARQKGYEDLNLNQPATVAAK